VRIEGQVLGEGEGRSKKQAEQAAARVAWGRLHEISRADDELAAEVSSGAGSTGTYVAVQSEEHDAGAA
jgi:hypothetical protein